MTAHTGEDMVQGEQASIAGEWINILPLWISIWQFLRKLVIDLPQDPTIPLLSVLPKYTPSYHKGTCSTIFIVVLFNNR